MVILQALWIAIETYRKHKPSWAGLMKRGMERDYSWDNAAVKLKPGKALLFQEVGVVTSRLFARSRN
nr:glycogen/starch synthase, ADP-glucose type [Tanacetum cinerariifolium]